MLLLATNWLLAASKTTAQQSLSNWWGRVGSDWPRAAVALLVGVAVGAIFIERAPKILKVLGLVTGFLALWLTWGIYNHWSNHKQKLITLKLPTGLLTTGWGWLVLATCIGLGVAVWRGVKGSNIITGAGATASLAFISLLLMAFFHANPST